MGKKKVVTKDNVVTIEDQTVEQSFARKDQVIITDEPAKWEEVNSDEQAASKSVAKKKGLSSFGSMLKAANAKRKKLYGKEN